MLLSDVILAPDTRANQPAATTVPAGTLYYVTDEQILERSNGTTWAEFSLSATDAAALVLSVLSAITFVTTADETADLTAARQLIAGSNITLDTSTPGEVTIAASGGSGGGVPDFIRRTINVWYPCFVSGTPTDAVIGTTITLSETGSQSAVITAAGHLILNYQSGAISGNDAGFRPSQLLLVRPDMNPDITIVLRTPSTMTDVRIWVGFIGTSNTNSDTMAGHGACFRYSTVAGDTGWTPSTRDGTTQTQGTAIGAAPAADTVYRLRIRTIDQGVTWKFSVDGGAEQDKTTNVPGTTQGLGYDTRVYTQTAAARNIGLCRVQLAFGAEIT